MFWAFKLGFVVDNFFYLQLFGLFFEKLGAFFSNLLVTLAISITPAFLGSLHNPSTWAISIPRPKVFSG
jgi:hypothetical protein